MAPKNMRDLVLLKIEGMKCRGCVKRITEELQLVPEVVSVDTVNLQTKLAAVFTVGLASNSALESAVSKTGKNVEYIQIIPSFLQSGSQRSEKAFLIRIEPLNCSSCVKTVNKVVEKFDGQVVHSSTEDKVVIIKVPVQVDKDKLVCSIQDETGKQVFTVLELGESLSEEENEAQGVFESKRDNSNTVFSFEYVFKWNKQTEDTHTWQESACSFLQESLGMENIHLSTELSSLSFAESSTKIEADDLHEALKDSGLDLQWFLCYQDLEEVLDETDSKQPIRTCRIEMSPLISCPHCKEKLSSLLNDAAGISKVEFLNDEDSMCLQIQLDSILGFQALERILETFGRNWLPMEATSILPTRFSSKDSEFVDNIVKELVVDYDTIESSKIDCLTERIAHLTGVSFVRRNPAETTSLRIVYDKSVLSKSELEEKVGILRSTLDSSKDSNSPTTSNKISKYSNTSDGKLKSLKKYNCGCQMPNCCCLSLPLSEDENFTQVVFKDSDSPRAINELASYLSCRLCKGKKNYLSQTEQKMCKEEASSSFDILPVSSCAISDSKPEVSPQSTEKSQTKTCKVTMRISGMSCASCVGAIENSLKQYDGIVHVSIGLITAMAKIEFIADKISPEEIKKVIESLGYEVSSPKVMNESEEQNSDDLFLHIAVDNSASSICEFLEQQPEVAYVKMEPMTSRVKHHFLMQLFPVFKSLTSSSSSSYLVTVCLNQSSVMKWRSLGGKSVESGEHINPKIRLVRRLDSDGFEYSIVNRRNASSDIPHLRQILEMEANEWFSRFIFSAIFTIPIMIFSFGLSNHVGAVDVLVGNSQITVAFLVEWILTTFVQFIGGYPFYRGSYYAIVRSHRPNMDVLIALATSIIYLYSVASLIYYSVVGKSSHDIDFDSSSMLITIVSLGKWLESIAKKNSAKGFEMLDELASKEVTVVCKDDKDDFVEIQVVPPELVMVGDMIKVFPGERLAVDGIIEAGKGSVDESAITGESLPAMKQAGNFVSSGTLNRNSILYVRITANGSQCTVSQILELVENAQSSHAPIENIADTISAYFVIGIVSVALLVFLIWIVITEKRVVPSSWYENENPVFFSLIFAVSVVAVACPCALGLATPSAFMTASSVAVRYGILLKEGVVIQYLYHAGCIIFDKTGTLTCGKPKVSEIQGLKIVAGLDIDKIISLVAQVESHSDHPYANAIVRYAEETLGLHVSKQVQSFEEIPGCGVQSMVSNHEIFIGNLKWIISKCCPSQEPTKDWFDKEYLEQLQSWMKNGSTVVVAAIDDTPCIAFRVDDELRPEAKQVVSFFREKNKMECWLVTGDNENTAFAVARAVGIPMEKVVSQALPGDKVKVVESLLQKCQSATGKAKSRVVFVGDGVNDGPALAAADVGVAMGTKSQLTASAARAILMTDNISGLATLFHLSKVTFRRILLNYFWALCYNVLFVPGAAGVLFPVIRKQMPPWFAAILMACSSLSVSLSSLSLRLYRPKNSIKR